MPLRAGFVCGQYSLSTTVSYVSHAVGPASHASAVPGRVVQLRRGQAFSVTVTVMVGVEEHAGLGPGVVMTQGAKGLLEPGQAGRVPVCAAVVAVVVWVWVWQGGHASRSLASTLEVAIAVSRFWVVGHWRG